MEFYGYRSSYRKAKAIATNAGSHMKSLRIGAGGEQYAIHPVLTHGKSCTAGSAAPGFSKSTRLSRMRR